MTAAAVFVHGIFSSSEVWVPLRARLDAHQEVAEAYAFPQFEYPSPKVLVNRKRHRPDLDGLADWLRTFLEHECRNHDSLVLIGHSQGGLIIQRYLARMLADGRGRDLRRIRSVVLLACPNDGSDFMLIGRRAFLGARNVQELQLRPHSEPVKAAQARVLNQIVNARHDSEISCRIPFHVFYGLEDGIVPVASARGPFAEPRALPGDHGTILAADRPDSPIVKTARNLLIDALHDPTRGRIHDEPTNRARNKAMTSAPAEHESDFDRTYELMESDAILSKSSLNLDACDVRYSGRRRMRGNAIEGIKRVAIDFTRESEAMLPFDDTNRPKLSLTAATRTGEGAIRLVEPRKVTGAAFVQDVEFGPPVGVDEIVDFTVAGILPAYKFAYLEDMLLASVDSPTGARSFEILARTISYPTDLLIMRVFLPEILGATPAGPKVGRTSRIDESASVALVSDHSYTEWKGDADGVPGVYMQLKVQNPRVNRKYRLAWNLPRRPK